MTKPKTAKIVEEICLLGCSRVNEIIALLENGEKTDAIQDLEKEEIDVIVTELKTIMAVYQKRS